jgi:uncharacterized membrane protein YecN with MAPEG domain
MFNGGWQSVFAFAFIALMSWFAVEGKTTVIIWAVGIILSLCVVMKIAIVFLEKYVEKRQKGNS